MSRAYRIRVREALVREQHAGDKITSRLELLDVLPEEEMAGLLKAELESRGFQERDGKLVRERDGVTVTVDPKSGEVTIEAGQDNTVELEGTREGYSYDDAGPGSRSVRDALTKDLRNELEKRAEQAQTELQAQATEKLEKSLCEVSDELEEAVSKVTAEALKKKAASLGRIKDIQEDEESGNLTITLEV